MHRDFLESSSRPVPAIHLGVVLNPLARSQRTASPRRRARFEAIVGQWGEVVETDSLASLQREVERLVPRVTHFVSVGGDGALHWLMNEVRSVLGDRDSVRWPVFVPTNAGTIDFVSRKAGVRGQPDAIVRAIAAAAAARRSPHEMRLDSIHITGEYDDGRAFDRIGFAVAAGGVGQRFFDAYDHEPNPGPLAIVRVIARGVANRVLEQAGLARRPGADRAARLFVPTRARVEIDGESLPQREHAAIHAGAFELNLGGVLRVFPLARRSGVLHFQAGEIGALAMVVHLPALATGGAVRAPGLRDMAGTCMVVEAEGEERLAPVIDGERFMHLRRLEMRPGPTVRIGCVRA